MGRSKRSRVGKEDEKLRLTMVLTPKLEFLQSVLNEFEKSLSLDENDYHKAYLLGLITSQLSLREYEIWWDNRPHVRFSIITHNELAFTIIDILKEFGYKVNTRRVGNDMIKITLPEEYVRDILMSSSPQGPTVAKIQRIVRDFLNSNNREEAEAIIREAKKIIKELNT